MRVLIVHPEDSPRRGPWARQRWDLIVDLGKSSPYSEAEWSKQYACPILRSESFRHGITDAKQVREIFTAGRNRLVDSEGIDWWDLASLLIVPDAMIVLALSRVAAQISESAELWATRLDWPSGTLSILLGRTPRSFEVGRFARPVASVMHYAGLFRRFSPAKIKEIFLDKYDSSYRWRSRFASRPKSSGSPVVLVPSAYGNVSRMAGAYATLLPQQSFLMVATRQSAKQFAPSNVQVQDLAAYAKGNFPASEVSSLAQRWMDLRLHLNSSPELRLLSQAGVLDSFPQWLRDGVGARNAWREVIDREPVCGVLCGDDSNLYTRLPVLLAARRKIPTVDFHHGAFDGRYLLKDLPCDVYLAKNEMERDYLVRVCGLASEKVAIGAPASEHDHQVRDGTEKSSAIFFSEPYENPGMRSEEVYRELLPPLCRVAKENGRGVIVKLHPFESLTQRSELVRGILGPEDARVVTMVEGPVSPELMAQAWFGITVESTTVLDCLHSGIRCFLCGWLSLSPYEYSQQYARFGVGELLHDAQQIGEIPARLKKLQKQAAPSVFSKAVDPAMLQRWLTSGSHEPSNMGSVS